MIWIAWVLPWLAAGVLWWAARNVAAAGRRWVAAACLILQCLLLAGLVPLALIGIAWTVGLEPDPTAERVLGAVGGGSALLWGWGGWSILKHILEAAQKDEAGGQTLSDDKASAEGLAAHLSDLCGRTITVEMLAYHLSGVAMLEDPKNAAYHTRLAMHDPHNYIASLADDCDRDSLITGLRVGLSIGLTVVD